MTVLVRPHPGGSVVVVRLQPGAHRAEVVGAQGDALKVRVCSPPTDGRANAELLEVLQRWAGDEFRSLNGQIEYLLRQALRGIVPDRILDRPKSGFGLPLRGLFHEVYAPQLRRLADSGRLDATGVFDGAGVLRLLEADRRGEVDAAYSLLGVLCVESWLRQFAHR